MEFSGGYNKPGNGSTYHISSLNIKTMDNIDIVELAEYVKKLPHQVQMPMNALVLHIFTVREYIHGSEKIN